MPLSVRRVPDRVARLAAPALLVLLLVAPLSDQRVDRVSACGTGLCRGGSAWTLAMGTIYNGLDSPQASIDRADALGLNTIRITDFLDVHGRPNIAPYDEQHWRRVDRVIAAAARAGIYVELDLSTYRNMLKTAGRNPYTVNWQPFMRYVVNRRNTVSGLRYGDDPTIALVAFAGEVDAVQGGDNTYGLTTGELTNFYRRVENYWHHHAPRQLLTSGGLSQLSWNSGIDWPTIFALPHNDVVAIHVYSADDLNHSLPLVAAYSHKLNKPWILEEFGYPAALGDRRRAKRFTAVYSAAQKRFAAGVGFWNIGSQTKQTYDVGPKFPSTAQVVRGYADSRQR